MSQPAIQTDQLGKIYTASFGAKKITALRDLTLSVNPGEIFGLLGPNGAGKTTTVKLLLNLSRATTGSATIFGIPTTDPRARQRIGYLPEGHRFPGYLTARETLSIFGRMSGVDAPTLNRRMMPLLERLCIDPWVDVRIRKFSKGMVQRLGIASALIHEPDLLLLDEPTDGVDPVGRREIRDLLREEAQKGKTIFLNSHLLSEIELMCDRVAILRRGSIAALGNIEELTRQESQYKFVASGIDESLVERFRSSGAKVRSENGHLLLAVRDIGHLNELIDAARSNGSLLSEVSEVRSSLEDVFVDLVKTGDASDALDARDPRETVA